MEKITEKTVYRVNDDIVNTIHSNWSQGQAPSRSSSRGWYDYCEQVGLKKFYDGGWYVESEPELTFLMLSLKH